MTIDRIRLSRMVFPCELGIFAWERRRTQALRIDLDLFVNLEPASGGSLCNTVDYAVVYEQVRFLARYGRWRLIESLAFALARHLLAKPTATEARVPLEAVSISLIKPEALQGRAIPQVQIHREQSWCTTHHGLLEPRSWSVEPLVETDEAGAYHLDLAPGATFEVPRGARGQLIAGRVFCDALELVAGAEFEPGGRLLENRDESDARLLLLAFPPLVGR